MAPATSSETLQTFLTQCTQVLMNIGNVNIDALKPGHKRCQTTVKPVLFVIGRQSIKSVLFSEKKVKVVRKEDRNQPPPRRAACRRFASSWWARGRGGGGRPCRRWAGWSRRAPSPQQPGWTGWSQCVYITIHRGIICVTCCIWENWQNISFTFITKIFRCSYLKEENNSIKIYRLHIHYIISISCNISASIQTC